MLTDFLKTDLLHGVIYGGQGSNSIASIKLSNDYFMNIQIATLDQVAKLQTGDILTRKYAKAAADGKTSDMYKVQSINPSSHMIELVMTGSSVSKYGSPWKTGRLFIEPFNLVAGEDWWV